MMMQRKPWFQELSQRRLPVRRVLAAVLDLSILALFTLNAVKAEGQPAEREQAHASHTRSRELARQTLVAETGRTRSQSRAGKRGAGKTSVGRTQVARGRSAKASHGAVKAEAGRGAVRGSKRGRKFEEEPVAMPVMRRAKAGRRGVEKTPKIVERESSARARKPVQRTLVASAGARGGVVRAGVRPVSRPALRSARPAPAEGTALTVDDFERAATPVEDAPVVAEKTYVPGESRTEEDNRVVGQRAPVAAKVGVARRSVVILKPVVKASAADDLADSLGTAVGSGTIDAPAMASSAAPTEDAANADDQDLPPVTALPKLRPLTRQEVTAAVEQPLLLPGLYRNGRLVVPAPLKGSHEILVHQNLMADDEGLERIEDEDDLRRMRAARLLVDFPESASLRVNPDLAANRRCARVWSVRFAGDIGRAFYARFKQPLQVNSAVRTVAYQVRLQRTNGNAAGVDGEAASPHLTGQAIDLGKRGMSVTEIAWMRAYLLPLMQAGKVDVEEEFQQACFHISVYKSYLPAAPKRKVVRTEVAQMRTPRVGKAVSNE